ncbi:MAG: site-specific DNA-methyltransferase [Saprospiraceae bacterium]|nr:site-specific DNA-methyltransferase [Saprospiraceae bacterium]
MLDKAELDFGIYRIMNEKRKDIEQFLEVDLVPQVQKVLAESLSIDKQAIQKELDDTIKQALGIGADPESLPKVHALRAKLGEAADMVGIENEVFSLLANFFKRYFDNGDFISMRRYKKDVYAIPYEGEEVKLHWANADQYYIKTSEYFKVYRFKLGGSKSVVFELVEASTEQNNNKAQGDKERRFAIQKTNPCEVAGDEFKIYFTYEPTEKGVKQNDLLQEAFDIVKGQIPKEFLELLSLRPTEKDRQRTLLQKHLMDYAARNTFDYFIHKDLGGFLTRELDFYIKNEVLFIDDLNTRDEQEFLKQLSKIKAIKKIGEKIIAFLAQLENFQKKLWLKKKMVVECQYCITLDRVPKELYHEIILNQAQIDEWVKLFAIHEITDQKAKDMFATDRVGFSSPLSLAFLDQNQFLVVDTALFSESFKWKLIGSIENFDEQCDGLLINSENFQALNLLSARFENTVKCIYTDPPYNTGNDGFAYKDGFLHSSWLSLICDRTTITKKLMNEASGCFISNIDKRELYNYKSLLDSIFSPENFVNSIVNVNNPKGRSDQKHLPTAHDNIVFYANDGFISYGWNPTNKVIKRYNKLDENGEKYREIDLRKTGDNDRRSDRENLFYYFYYNEKTKELVPSRVQLDLDDFREIVPMKDEVIEGNWRWELDTARDNLKRLIARYMPVKKQWSVFEMDYYIEGDRVSPTSVWDEKPFNSERGTKSFIALGFDKEDFPRPKPIGLMTALFEHTTTEGDYILDYFLGSGTTICGIIELNANTEKCRKYIGCEMGEYFDKITMPRILKTIYCQEWEDGKPVSREGISHCFKYLRLESYEDTLNNLQLTRNNTQELALNSNPKFKEGYMLHYMLDVESQGSLLNLDWFINPFECYLQVTKNNELVDTKVDLVETFNYLIGLVVENYAVPKDGYVVVTGKNLAGESILVIWRDCAKHDNPALNIFLEKSKYNPLDGEFDRIFVNGDNNVENLKTGDERWKVVLIEEEFKKRMFENS